MTALACDMSAIPPAERGEHQRVGRLLVAAAIDLRASVNGMVFQLPADEYDAAVQFIARERLCCPFLRFRVEVTPGRGPLRLSVDGPAGAGEFLRSELQLPPSRG